LALAVVDVTDPRSVSVVGTVAEPDGGTTMGVAVSGRYAMTAKYAILYATPGLHILDVTDPTSPKRLSTYAGVGVGVTVSGRYAYVVANGAFEVLDLLVGR
jgi:hypothetical protein